MNFVRRVRDPILNIINPRPAPKKNFISELLGLLNNTKPSNRRENIIVLLIKLILALLGIRSRK